MCIRDSLFTEMKDFIDSSSDFDRQSFINSALTTVQFQNGYQVKHHKESDLNNILNAALKRSDKAIEIVIINNLNQRRYIGVKLD